MYNPQLQQPQYYHQMYGSSSSTMNSPYYYGGYSLAQSPRGPFSTVPAHHQQPPPPPPPQRIAGPPSYLYYPNPPHLEGSFSTTTFPHFQPTTTLRHPFPSPTGTIIIFIIFSLHNHHLVILINNAHIYTQHYTQSIYTLKDNI